MHTTPCLSLAASGLLTLALAAPAAAQSPAAAASPASGPVGPAVQNDRNNQAIERIRVEDKGSRIEELRVGGQTQSISVQPKNDMPAYEVRPADAQGSNSAGQRMWTFKKF
jgi:hypothetical protein